MFSGVSTGTQIDVCKIPLYPPFKKGGFSYTQFLIPDGPIALPLFEKRGARGDLRTSKGGQRNPTDRDRKERIEL